MPTHDLHTTARQWELIKGQHKKFLYFVRVSAEADNQAPACSLIAEGECLVASAFDKVIDIRWRPVMEADRPMAAEYVFSVQWKGEDFPLLTLLLRRDDALYLPQWDGSSITYSHAENLDNPYLCENVMGRIAEALLRSPAFAPSRPEEAKRA